MEAKVLIVAKTPAVDRIAAEDRARLVAAGAANADRLADAAESHRAGLAAVRSALAGACLREVRVTELAPGDGRGADLVVTVGGDGTVFTANLLATDAPFITVNSDPVGSVGHYTRCKVADFAERFAAWRSGQHRIEPLPRLAVRGDGGVHRFLNDCLFTSRNPAALTRLVLECPEGRELQRSSGVWVATAAGSTGAIRSAGSTPLPDGREPALLWRVREPFLGLGAPQLIEGCQRPPAWLRLTAAMPGCALFLDGPNITVPLRPGETVAISAASEPLRLVV